MVRIHRGLLDDGDHCYNKFRAWDNDQPMFGLNFEVTTHVRYILTDRESGNVVLNETVVAPYTATVGDAFVAIKRLRLANEGSGRKNIEGLLDLLASLRIGAEEVSLKQ